MVWMSAQEQFNQIWPFAGTLTLTTGLRWRVGIAGRRRPLVTCPCLTSRYSESENPEFLIFFSWDIKGHNILQQNHQTNVTLQPLAGVTETDGSESKENRVSSSSSSSSPPPSDGPTPPPSSIELPTSSSLPQRPPDPLSVPPEGSLQDLRAPAPLPTASATSSSSSTPLEASGATPSSSEPLGPRMKDVAKEKKITGKLNKAEWMDSISIYLICLHFRRPVPVQVAEVSI